jgi:hypothetical protein
MKTVKELDRKIKDLGGLSRMHILYDLDENFADLCIHGECIPITDYTEECEETVDLTKLKRLQSNLIRRYGESLVGEMEEANA